MLKIILVLTLLAAGSPALAVVCNILDYEIRVDNCAGEGTDFESNLKRACRSHPGETLAKCRRNCVSRNKVGVCQECGWKQVSTAACTDTGDRMKMRHCDENQTAFASSAVKTAKVLTKILETHLFMARTLKLSAGEADKLAMAAHKAGKVREWLNKDRKFLCKDDRGLCKGGTIAAAYPLTGGAVAVRLCDPFFNKDVKSAAAVLIHEATHSCCATTDKYYYTPDHPPLRRHNWQNIADTYWYWIQYGFCLPAENTCVKQPGTT